MVDQRGVATRIADLDMRAIACSLRFGQGDDTGLDLLAHRLVEGSYGQFQFDAVGYDIGGDAAIDGADGYDGGLERIDIARDDRLQ